MRDRCKKHYLPATSFTVGGEGGNNYVLYRGHPTYVIIFPVSQRIFLIFPDFPTGCGFNQVHCWKSQNPLMFLYGVHPPYKSDRPRVTCHCCYFMFYIMLSGYFHSKISEIGLLLYMFSLVLMWLCIYCKF